METRMTDFFCASPATPAPGPDLHERPPEPVDDTMAMEYTEQLLTPEHSRSETSSNNENASAEEKPAVRRRSTRVTRASLRGAVDLNPDPESIQPGLPTPVSENEPTVSGETLVAAVADRGKQTRASHLRHSIAVMEAAAWSQATLAGEDNNHGGTDEPAVAPGTPVSNSSQEPQPGEGSSSLPRRTLRKRVERVLTQDGDNHRAAPSRTTPSKAESPQSPPRRSSRISILDKASALVDRAATVLGKRSRDATDQGGDAARRTSLRPRNVAPVKMELTASEPPALKKRRVSESDLPSKVKSPEKTPEEASTVKTVTWKPKLWLSHGLYTGQEHTDARPSHKRDRITKVQGSRTPQRTLLPLPMFAGDRLLKSGRDFTLPFDVFSPLPVGQPKPNEWRKTNKNVFVGDASSIWRANKPLELSKCMCVEETGCDENCQNRYMFFECDDGNCALGPNCGNRSFEELKHRAKAGGKYNVGVEVIKTEDRGYGVRSNRTFEPNQIIVEYTGEIITQSECEKRMRTIYKTNECYYLMYFDQNMIIDATRGSIARFVNHSCDPNCRMEKWTVAGKPRMALFAGDRGIMTGEELTYDYNFDPYSQKNVQQCRCGSVSCRGVLGPRPREKERAREAREAKAEAERQKKRDRANSRRRAAKQLAGTKRKNEKVLKGSASRVNKRRPVPSNSRSVKSGVQKAVSKARGSSSTQTASRARNSKANSKASTKSLPKKAPAKSPVKKSETKPKTNVRLPKVAPTKTKARAPARSRKPQAAKPNEPTKAQTKPKPKAQAETKAKAQAAETKTSKLSRPSAETKAKILAAAKGKPAKRTPKKAMNTKSNKSPTKSAPKARVATPKQAQAKASKSVKSPARKASPKTTKAKA
ncbi:hypothetical protein P168DRAFT_313945 [Aspergillus campestris IBT 28561]|uniref:SET domain-containing protein n=1 Tax=Aspergillus campestris (strain IBT 28561) TaxID=1392248 RepID=A0A2I1DD75_ASPC2|nr:uncharacterized protein P168DRAFT_313945 [Aspergillus campestris IBT 28561]PKY07800.1 hypothetical protein P168DRAFT_313945 [Aspergillus campestris IBT 28561]